jgi:hypothetical protein
MTVDGGYLDNLLGPMEAQDDGTPLAKRAAWNFKDGVKATDNPGADTVDITAPLASGGSGGTVPPLGVANTVLVTDGATMSWSKIVDANVAVGAAILGTKIAPDFGTQNVTTSGNITTTGGYMAIGATVAGSGDFRLDDTGSVVGWGGAGDVQMLRKDGTDNVILGGSNTNFSILQAAGADSVVVSSTYVSPQVPTLGWATGVVAPSLTQFADSTNGVVADTMSIRAQTASDAFAGTGGGLDLSAGAGATADGACSMTTAAGLDRVTVAADGNVDIASIDSALFNAAGYAGFGTTPAGAGNIRLPDTGAIGAWGPGTNNTIDVISKDAGDNIYVGKAVLGDRPASLDFSSTSGHWFRTGTSSKVIITATDVDLRIPLTWSNVVVAPFVSHDDDSTVAVTADDLYISAQGVSAGSGTATSGNLGIKGGTASGSATNKDGNVWVHVAPASWNSGERVVFRAEATVVPAGNPVAGVYDYVEAGAAKIRGTGGTITTYGPAEPHCPECGRDCAHEWENPAEGWALSVCMWCLTDAMNDAGVMRKEQRAA